MNSAVIGGVVVVMIVIIVAIASKQNKKKLIISHRFKQEPHIRGVFCLWDDDSFLTFLKNLSQKL